MLHILKGRNRWGTEVSVATPDDSGLWLVLLSVAAIVFVAGVMVSGIRWHQLSLNPFRIARASTAIAAQRGARHFWAVWVLFSVAIVLLIAAAFVGLYRLSGD